MTELILSPKYINFLKHEAEAEALEGQTMAGKTTVGVVKFMFKVAKSDDKIHFIASKTTGDCEKNIIQPDLGIMDVFGNKVTYHGNGDKDNKIPHLKYTTPKGVKVVYVLGYDNKEKWQKALGSQFGCGFIDEVNTANIDFVQEATMRCKYWMCTMNPDDPNLPIYKGYINRFRPLEKYKNDTPKEIQEMLIEPEHPKWTYWFFSMDHNHGVSEERKEQVRNSVPKGTKLHKNKIQGIRGRSEGIIFRAFDRQRNVISQKQAKSMRFVSFACGVDTSYSSTTEDTLAFIYQGLTADGEVVVLEEAVYNNKDFVGNGLAPSDVAVKLTDFLNRCKDKWGFGRMVYIDNADQGTIKELRKYQKAKGLLYDFLNSDKTMKIADRIILANGWLQDGKYLIVEHCEHHIGELEVYAWKEDKDIPEDRNDHTINAQQYGAMKWVRKIGQKQQADHSYSALKAGFGLG